MKFGRIFVFAAFLAAPCAFAGDISGFWKHTDEPGWFEINLDEGKGTVVRNDEFPDRVGREILKDLSIVEYPSVAAFIGMTTSEEYKGIHVHREAGLQHQLLVEC